MRASNCSPLVSVASSVKTFGRTAPQAEDGVLAALLVFALVKASMLAVLGCVVVVGVSGAATAKKSILFIQALPTATAIGASLAS